MPVGELLMSMFTSAAYDAVKGTAAGALAGGEADDVAAALAAAYDRACDRFFDRHGDRFGTPTSSFLARQENADRALRATFLGGADLVPGEIDPRGFDGVPAATPDALDFFVEVLRGEMRRERSLDRILEEKSSHRLLRGVDRTLQEVRDALVAPSTQDRHGDAYEGVRAPEAHVTDTVRSITPICPGPLVAGSGVLRPMEGRMRLTKSVVDLTNNACIPYLVS